MVASLSGEMPSWIASCWDADGIDGVMLHAAGDQVALALCSGRLGYALDREIGALAA